MPEATTGDVRQTGIVPAVSAVIPVYNPGPHLVRALRSVLDQTMSDLEVIVVDDGGAEDVGWVESVDPRVRLVRQSNVGVSAARNRGVLEARSDWVAFCDQDDEWLPDKLAVQLRAARGRPEAAFCHTHFWWVSGDTDSLGEPLTVTYRGLLADQHVCLSSVMVSRQAYWRAGGHDPMLRVMQDYDLFLRLSLLADEPPLSLAEPLVRYHLHDANVSRDYCAAYQERVDLLHRHLRHALRREDAVTEEACRRGLRRARGLYGAQAFEQARSAAHDWDVALLARHLGRAAVWNPGLVGRRLVFRG